MTKETTQAIAAGLTKAAPHWVALVILVVVFLIYMDRTHDTAKQVADQRIKVCHDVQIESTDVLKNLVGRLELFATEYALMRQSLEKHQQEISEENKKLLDLHKELLLEMREHSRKHHK